MKTIDKCLQAMLVFKTNGTETTKKLETIIVTFSSCLPNSQNSPIRTNILDYENSYSIIIFFDG